MSSLGKNPNNNEDQEEGEDAQVDDKTYQENFRKTFITENKG